MNVSLGRRWDEFVTSKVEAGDYQSASEVLRAALRLLSEQDAEREAKLEALRAAIDDGLRSASEVEPSAFDEAAVERVKRKGRKKAGLDAT